MGWVVGGEDRVEVWMTGGEQQVGVWLAAANGEKRMRMDKQH